MRAGLRRVDEETRRTWLHELVGFAVAKAAQHRYGACGEFYDRVCRHDDLVIDRVIGVMTKSPEQARQCRQQVEQQSQRICSAILARYHAACRGNLPIRQARSRADRGRARTAEGGRARHAAPARRRAEFLPEMRWISNSAEEVMSLDWARGFALQHLSSSPSVQRSRNFNCSGTPPLRG